VLTAAEQSPLSRLMADIGGEENGLLLKMDAEGAELAVFASISRQVLVRFDQVVVELHWLRNLAAPAFATMFSAALSRLQRAVHAVPCACE